MGRSSPSVVILSPPPLSARLSVTSRRSFAMLPLTSSKRWPPLLPPPPSRSPMSFPTVKSSPSVTSVSVPPRPSSNLPSWEWNPAESTRPPTTPSSAMLTSGRTCTLTPSCPEAPPCTLVLLIVCKRRSPLLPHPLSTGSASNFSTNLLLQLLAFQLLNRFILHCHLIVIDSNVHMYVVQ